MASRKEPIRLESFSSPQYPVMKIASEPLAVSENSKMSAVLRTMLTDHKIPKRPRRLPVASKKDGVLRGIISTTDVLDFLGAGEKYKIFREKKLDTVVSKVMTREVRVLKEDHDLAKAIEIMKKSKEGLYPVVQGDVLLGILSQWDIVKGLNRKTGLEVSDIMVYKPHTARAHYSILETAKMMVRGGFRRLPVTEKGFLTGIITPYDILSYITENKINLRKATQSINRLMVRDIETITAKDDVFTAISIMKNKNVGGLPVVEDEELIGIITEKDVLDSII